MFYISWGRKTGSTRDITSTPKYCFIFPVIVLALFGASLVRLPCPVCGGKGRVSLTAFPMTLGIN